MKTLRNTMIVVIALAGLNFTNLSATGIPLPKKSTKIEVALDPTAKKIRKMSDEAIRETLSGIFNKLVVDYSGKVNIVFKVTGDKQIEVLNVYGYNPALVSAVKQAVAKEEIIVPAALEGKYMVPVVF
jgi:hypothetical protein